MGLRIRRSITLFKGVKLNFSKSGISTTIGKRGASVTIGKTRSSVNVGIPGTGISYRKEFKSSTKKATQNETSQYIIEVNENDSNVFIVKTTSGEIVTDPAIIATIKNSFDMDKIERDPSHSKKNRLTALILCVLFGWLGVHRFYVGKTGTGILYLLTVGGLIIGLIVDLIKILSGKFTDKQNKPLVEWK